MGKIYLFIVAVIIILVAATGLLFVSQNKKAALNQAGNQKVQQQIPTETGQQTTTQSGTAPKTGDIPLSVSEPQNGTTSQVSVINVKGKTAPNAEVYVNDKQVQADSSGAFTVSLALDEGDNYILVAAADTSGGYSEKELTMIYEPVQ